MKRVFSWIVRSTVKRAPEWLGWGVAKDFYRDCLRIRSKAGSGFFTLQKQRYVKNINLESKIRGMQFNEVLARWGIRSRSDLASAIRACQRARLAGILLTAFFGVFFGWQIFVLSQSAWWRTLHGAAGISFLAAGVVRWTTASWRLRVFRHKRFIPYVFWVSRLGHIDWQNRKSS